MEMTRHDPTARAPVPLNPLKKMRLALGWTLDHTASLLGTSRQFVIRAEQGVYADPPPRLLTLLLDYTEPELFNTDGGLDAGSFTLAPAAVGDGLSDEVLVYHQYHAWQTLTRKRNYGALNPTWDFTRVSASNHPFLRWRRDSGLVARIGISKLYCVHPALITKFENSPHLVSHVPPDLRAALLESGYSIELLDSLENAYHTYKVSLSEEFRRKQGLTSDE